MSVMNKNIKELIPIMISMLFMISGLTITPLVIHSLVNEVSLRRIAVETEGIITRIDIYSLADETMYRLRVAYTVGGERYESRLNYWRSGMREGQTVKFYYDPSNPNRIISVDNTVFLNLYKSFIGVSSFLSGFFIFYIDRKRRKLKKALLANGQRVMADISEITKVSKKIGNITTFNDRYYLICKWTDNAGKDHFFKSNPFLSIRNWKVTLKSPSTWIQTTIQSITWIWT